MQVLFSLNYVSTNFQRSFIIRFLSPVDELKSIKWFTLLASRDVRKTNSVLVFGNLNSSFDRDDISCVCSSSMLFRGSFESCELATSLATICTSAAGVYSAF